ncbi:PAAR-like domain-containing protein [Halomonas kalidii]|uniref:DUF4150 domain-containing protein n=1 Tax=Halomonas kalidii TaxID=3043293 RepID=A0ABT6VK96_9GAMM|nr:PAAR-like domain-containing protein [Halomonas kalidii]MDI5933171.1 DUF4150 domain-containing protein [Halomonas kalidii]
MGNDVFANGREISCKAADGKAIAAFPDVCMTPPENPTTPPGVPVPYPNTGMAKDATSGSKSVKISRKEVMLKNKSYFKKSTGDEAGSATKKGVVTSKNRGKVYFTAWSMNVKFEGENVVRHMDMTTHNHASQPANTIPWLYSDTMDPSTIPDDCKQVANNFNEHCGDKVGDSLAGTNKAMCDDKDCAEARECIVTPYNLGCCPPGDDEPTPHHIVPASQFHTGGEGAVAILSKVVDGEVVDKYNARQAPCICTDGKSHSVGTHGKIHRKTNNKTVRHPDVSSFLSKSGKSISKDARWEVKEAEKVGGEAVSESTECDAECIEAQVRQSHQNMGIDAEDNVRPTTAGTVDSPVSSTSSGGL